MIPLLVRPDPPAIWGFALGTALLGLVAGMPAPAWRWVIRLVGSLLIGQGCSRGLRTSRAAQPGSARRAETKGTPNRDRTVAVRAIGRVYPQH